MGVKIIEIGENKMEWPNEIHPKKTRYLLIENLRKLNFGGVVTLLVSGYIAINLLFALIYNFATAVPQCRNFIDYIYFSFVTGLTIGFGDLTPIGPLGKILTVFHGLISSLYFALTVAFLGVKMLFPNHTLHFSDKVLFDGTNIVVRVLNSHRALLVNPDFRISLVVHCHGNVTAETFPAVKIDNIHWLDNHDFIIGFPDRIDSNYSIYDEYKKAKSYGESDPNGKNEKTRFKIRISVSGTYGMQQYVQVVSYGVNDLVKGGRFMPIKYSNEDKKIWRNIRFCKFENFWNQFNTIEDAKI